MLVLFESVSVVALFSSCCRRILSVVVSMSFLALSVDADTLSKRMENEHAVSHNTKRSLFHFEAFRIPNPSRSSHLFIPHILPSKLQRRD